MNSSLQAAIALLLLVVVSIGVWQYVNRSGNDEQADKPGSGLLKTEPEFRDKLTELVMQREKVKNGIEKLRSDKSRTLKQLRDKGVRSSEDFRASEDQEVKKLAINLKQWNQQIAKLEKEVGYYDEAISSIEVMLDKIERERINESVSLSDQEYRDLQKIIVDLDERLEVETDFLEDEQLGELIDEEMSAGG